MFSHNMPLLRASQCTTKRILSSLKGVHPMSSYIGRHIGPQPEQTDKMLSVIGYNSIDKLLEDTIPGHIRLNNNEITSMQQVIGNGAEESEALNELKQKMSKNIVNKSFIGMGYYDCLTPTPILRNIIENPSWYTPYTPYQAEIAQGRLEMLLNFQTMIKDIVGWYIYPSVH